VTKAAEHSYTVASEHSLPAESALRLIGAALQILATWAVVRALDPDSAGIYFRGFVIACGVAALLRAKYELYMAYHIIGGRAAAAGAGDGVLLRQLGRRVLLRSSLACAALLVVMTDIDIQAPRLQPALETYLPFVLAIPFISLSRFLGEALRAANRTLPGTIVAAYAQNLSILAIALVPTGASLTLYVWTFFAGCLASAAVAVALALRVFPADWKQGLLPIAPEVLRAADEREMIGLGRAALLWGPLTVLAVFSTTMQMAEYAVAVRTAMVIDFFLPALNLSGGRELQNDRRAVRPSHALLVSQLRNALFFSSIFVAVLIIFGSTTLRLYGYPYNTQLVVYVLLLCEQWINSVSRPALRFVMLEWDRSRIRTAVGFGAAVALFVCCSTIGLYGALAVAAATLSGAVVLNSWAIVSALRTARANP
jgi:hypothetical protein